MKRLLILILATLSFSMSFSILAQDLTQENLNGKWKVLPESAEYADLGGDFWIFESGKYRVTSAGKSIGRPDAFRIEGNKIIYGQKPWEAIIKVLSISKDKMQVNTSGIIQNLERVK